jgi:hypothetical protein
LGSSVTKKQKENEHSSVSRTTPRPSGLRRPLPNLADQKVLLAEGIRSTKRAASNSSLASRFSPVIFGAICAGLGVQR